MKCYVQYLKFVMLSFKILLLALLCYIIRALTI